MPSSVQRVDVLPGVSDHDMVFAEFDLQTATLKQQERSIPLYKKANWEQLCSDLESLLPKLTIMYNDSTKTANHMWNLFKSAIHKGIKDHVPHKRAKRKNKHPWIGGDLKKLMKRQKRVYKQKKKSQDQEVNKKYKQMKREVQRQQRNAYWKYIEDVVTPSEEDNNNSGSKKFWTFIKHRRKDKVGITSLKSEGKLFTDSASKANILNQQFQSAFSIKSIFTSNQFAESIGMKNRSTQQLSSITISTPGI